MIKNSQLQPGTQATNPRRNEMEGIQGKGSCKGNELPRRLDMTTPPRVAAVWSGAARVFLDVMCAAFVDYRSFVPAGLNNRHRPVQTNYFEIAVRVAIRLYNCCVVRQNHTGNSKF